MAENQRTVDVPASDAAGGPASDPAGGPASDPAGGPASDPASDPASATVSDSASDPASAAPPPDGPDYCFGPDDGCDAQQNQSFPPMTMNNSSTAHIIYECVHVYTVDAGFVNALRLKILPEWAPSGRRRHDPPPRFDPAAPGGEVVCFDFDASGIEQIDFNRGKSRFVFAAIALGAPRRLVMRARRSAVRNALRAGPAACRDAEIFVATLHANRPGFD